MALVTDRHLAAALKPNQLAMHGERQPKGRQAQSQQSSDGSHGAEATADPRPRKRNVAYRGTVRRLHLRSVEGKLGDAGGINSRRYEKPLALFSFWVTILRDDQKLEMAHHLRLGQSRTRRCFPRKNRRPPLIP